MNQTFSDVTIFLNQNSWVTWICVIAGSFLLTFLFKLLLKFLIPKIDKLTKRTLSIWDDALILCLKSIKSWVIFLSSFSFLVHLVSKEGSINKIASSLFVIGITWQLSVWVLIIMAQWREKVLSKKMQEHASSAAAINLMVSALQMTIILVFVLIALSNLGVDITAMIASLGIGGIAIALAAQNILADLFASISIVLDKPFVVGDKITVGNESGTVEYIGVKTTRVRADAGEELIFSNKDLLQNRIHNHKRLYKRRVQKRVSVFRSAVNVEKIKEISAWVNEYLPKVAKVKLDTFRVISSDTTYIDFDLVYYIEDHSSTYAAEVQEKLILDIMIQFEKYNISVTSPKGEDSRMLVSLIKDRFSSMSNDFNQD